MDQDQVPLIEDQPTSRWRRKSTIVCLVVFIVGLIALCISIGVGYFMIVTTNAVSLKIMSLNTWGMPASLGSYDKEARMHAIGQYINQSEHDIYLLEELWMRPDYYTVMSYVPGDWYYTTYSEMTNGGCDGTVAPDGCSGLSIVSKYPFIEKSFNVYNDHGDIMHITDGEYLARKGFGRVRIEPKPGHIVDVYLTHTCASDYNDYYRQRQVKQLVEAIKQSDADFVVLGGDFNADPVVNGHETTLKDLNEAMVSAIEEFFKKIQNWLIPREATYGNPKNSYSFSYGPVHYDYIFHKANKNNSIWTNLFDVPIFKFNKDSEHRVSFSDHEAVTAHLYLSKPDNQNN